MEQHQKNGLMFLGVCVCAGFILAVLTFSGSKRAYIESNDDLRNAEFAAPEDAEDPYAEVPAETEPDDLAAAISMLGDAPSEMSEETPLQLEMIATDRQLLENGSELFVLTGRVTNPTAENLVVPALHVQLHSSSGELIHSWRLRPPAQELGPNSSTMFRNAEMEAPAGGDQLTVTIGPPAD